MVVLVFRFLQTSLSYIEVVWNLTFVKRSKSPGSLWFFDHPWATIIKKNCHRMNQFLRNWPQRIGICTLLKVPWKWQNHKSIDKVGMKCPIHINLTSLSTFLMLFNWIHLMAMLMTPRAIAKIVKMAILALMATIVMANGNFIMVIRGIQLQSMNKLAQ